jgi:DNA-binding NtrC family response regulator
MSPPGGSIEPDHLSADLTAPISAASAVSNAFGGPARSVQAGNLAAAIEAVERELITATLDRTRGNISETARNLGLTRRGLYLKMARLGLEAVAADT